MYVNIRKWEPGLLPYIFQLRLQVLKSFGSLSYIYLNYLRANRVSLLGEPDKALEITRYYPN